MGLSGNFGTPIVEIISKHNIAQVKWHYLNYAVKDA